MRIVRKGCYQSHEGVSGSDVLLRVIAKSAAEFLLISDGRLAITNKVIESVLQPLVATLGGSVVLPWFAFGRQDKQRHRLSVLIGHDAHLAQSHAFGFAGRPDARVNRCAQAIHVGTGLQHGGTLWWKAASSAIRQFLVCSDGQPLSRLTSACPLHDAIA